MLYFDTLKVSSLDKTSQSTSAKGGKGNSDLIYWDYGKEINLSIEDALYTPASQGLMWGGKFGTKRTKLYGVWNPIDYDLDDQGKPIYLEKIMYEEKKEDISNDISAGWYSVTDEGKVTLITEKVEDELIGETFDSTNFTRKEDVLCYILPMHIGITEGQEGRVGVGSLSFDTDETEKARRIYLTNETLSALISNIDVLLEKYSYEDTSDLYAMKHFLLKNGVGYYLTNPEDKIDGRDIEPFQPYYYLGDSETIEENVKTQTYLDEVQTLRNFYSTLGKGAFATYICPCDGSLKVTAKIPIEKDYKYISLGKEYLHCPKDYRIVNSPDGRYGKLDYCYTKKNFDETKQATIEQAREGHGPATPLDVFPERAELIFENYGDFSTSNYSIKVEKGSIEQSGTPPIEYYVLDETEGDETLCVYQQIETVETPDITVGCKEEIDAYGYKWKNSDIKMTSLERSMDVYRMENVTLRYRVPANSSNWQISIAQKGLYKTLYADGLWAKNGGKELTNFTTWSRSSVPNKSYGWFDKEFLPEVDFYIDVDWDVPITNDYRTKKFTTKVKVGTFYIFNDESSKAIQEFMTPCSTGVEDVQLLETFNKYRAETNFAIDTDRNIRMSNYRFAKKYNNCELQVFIDPKTMKPYEPNTYTFRRKNGSTVSGNLRVIKKDDIYYKWQRAKSQDYSSLGKQIIVDAEHFPGVFKLVGETFARKYGSNEDEHYQIEIPLCKLFDETSLKLEAAGDPTTFSMKLKVLRKEDGQMMKLTQYVTEKEKFNGFTSNSEKVTSTDKDMDVSPFDIDKGDFYDTENNDLSDIYSTDIEFIDIPAAQRTILYQKTFYTIISPLRNTEYNLNLDGLKFYTTDSREDLDESKIVIEKVVKEISKTEDEGEPTDAEWDTAISVEDSIVAPTEYQVYVEEVN